MVQIPPASVMATWPTPNYVDPVLLGNAVEVINYVFYPTVLTIIGLRLFTRTFISKSFGPDDYLIIAALIPTTAFAAVALISELHFDLNRHVWDVPIPDLIVGLKLVLVSQIIFAVAQGLTKLSMLSLVYRIMSTTSHRMQKVTIALMIAIIADGLIFVVVVIFQCRPISQYWTLSVTPQQCINQSAHVLIASIINTFTDLFVVILPIPTVLKLQIPRRQVIVVIMLFGGGFIVCIAGAVRTYYTHRAVLSFDPSWDQYPNWISSSVELYVGMICASIPATKPFFQRYIPKLLDSAMSTAARPRLTFGSSKDKSFSSGGLTTSRNSPAADVELGNINGPFKRLDEAVDDKGSARLSNIDEVQSPASISSISSFHTGTKDFNPPGPTYDDRLLSIRSGSTQVTYDNERLDSLASQKGLLKERTRFG